MYYVTINQLDTKLTPFCTVNYKMNHTCNQTDSTNVFSLFFCIIQPSDMPQNNNLCHCFIQNPRYGLKSMGTQLLILVHSII